MNRLSEVYNAAEKYLTEKLDDLSFDESGAEILNTELRVYREREPYNRIEDIYRNLLGSLKNRSMMASVIPEIEEFDTILLSFNPQKILSEDFDEERLLKLFEKGFPNKQKTNMYSEKSLWRQFARGVLSSASFMRLYNTADDFNNFVASFQFNEYATAALPMLLAKEIKGLGFSLACDFLKESGYQSYGKPDVHLKDIFEAAGIVNNKSDYEIFKVIVKMAKEVDEKPVIVDKLFWLIGSSRFEEYNRLSFNNIPVKSHLKEDFIELLRRDR